MDGPSAPARGCGVPRPGRPAGATQLADLLSIIDDIPYLHVNGIKVGIAELASVATVVGERLPQSLWPMLSQRKSTSDIALGVRRAFDPDGIMNPGILDIA